MSAHEVSRRAARSPFVPSPVFVLICVLTVTTGFLAWARLGNVRFAVFMMVLCGWLVSLCLHEYAHAVVGYLSGDRSVADRGYLRLNPLKYTHPLLSIVLPLLALVIGGIGLPGGAVWIDHTHIGSRAKRSLISAAGPLTNVLFALVLTVPFIVTGVTGGMDFGNLTVNSPHPEFWAGLAWLALLQVMATVLNFLPVPGLDGGNILQPWLSAPYRRAFDLFAPYGFILLFGLLWQSRINQYFFGAVAWLADHIGIPSSLAGAGYEVMRFWS